MSHNTLHPEDSANFVNATPCLTPCFLVNRLIEAPLVMKGRYVGRVGKFVDWAEGPRPVGLEFDGGERVWFREDEVTLIREGKVYPF